MLDMKKMIRFYEQAFAERDVRQRLNRYPILNAGETDEFIQSVRADLLQAVKLVLSFYKGVIQQSATDRPFADRFNQSTGSLSQLGIASDKIFASMFLLGDDAFPLDPNRGVSPVSILSLRKSNIELRPFVDEQLLDVFVEGGDMYAGFSDIIRSLYVWSASRSYELSGDLSDLQTLRVNCYSLSSFANRFNTSVAVLGNTFRVINQFDPALNPDFQGETSIIALRVGDIVLAAGQQLNPLSAAVLSNNDKVGGRSLAALYQRIVYSRQSLTCE